MAFAAATGNTGLTTTTAGAVTLGKAFANNVASHSLIVTDGVVAPSAGTLTCADSVNGAHTEAKNQDQAALGQKNYIFYFLDAGAGATTVTLTADTTRAMWIDINEYTVASAPASLDGTPVSANASVSSAPDSGAITTTAAGIVVCSGSFYPMTINPPTAGLNFTRRAAAATGGPTYGRGYEDYITPSSGTYNGVWTSLQDYWSCLAAAFKEAGGGGGGGSGAGFGGEGGLGTIGGNVGYVRIIN